jgi:uncharacterized membrane protein YkoI
MTRLTHCLLFAAAISVAGPAAADGEHRRDHDHDRAREALARGDILPLSTFLPALEARYGARLLEVELEQDYGRFVYQIQLITAEGKVIVADVDGATGLVIPDEPKSEEHE